MFTIQSDSFFAGLVITVNHLNHQEQHSHVVTIKKMSNEQHSIEPVLENIIIRTLQV